MTPETIGWIAAVLSALCFLIGQRMIASDLHWVKRHHARFRMFAVRDRLVRMVADGNVDEDDIAWSSIYATVNSLLELQRNHSVWAQLRDWVQHRERMRRHPKRREHLRRTMDAIRDRAANDDDFAQTLRDMDAAHHEMSLGQTHWLDRVGLRILRVVLRALMLVMDPFGKVARAEKERARLEEEPVYPLTAADEVRQVEDRKAVESKPVIDWYKGVRPKSATQLIEWMGDADTHSNRTVAA